MSRVFAQQEEPSCFCFGKGVFPSSLTRHVHEVREPRKGLQMFTLQGTVYPPYPTERVSAGKSSTQKYLWEGIF